MLILPTLVMLARLRVDCAAQNGAQCRRCECPVPGMWGVYETKGLNRMEE
jgi:hypothetical protein